MSKVESQKIAINKENTNCNGNSPKDEILFLKYRTPIS